LIYYREKELAEHGCLAEGLAILVFFADPDSPWQHGTNETTTGLLCEYSPVALGT
jgi:IS30 family transposase